MKQKSESGKTSAKGHPTRRQYSADERIRIVLEGLRGEENISELWRRRHRRFDVLRLLQGVPGSWQTPIGGRHGTRRDLRRAAHVLHVLALEPRCQIVRDVARSVVA
jgi:hypothetical protein